MTMKHGRLTTFEAALLHVLDTDGEQSAQDVLYNYGIVSDQKGTRYGTVFKRLRALEQKKLITSGVEAKREGKPGPPRVLFRLRKPGRDALVAAKKMVGCSSA